MFIPIVPVCKGLHNLRRTVEQPYAYTYQVSERIRDAIDTLKADWSNTNTAPGDDVAPAMPYLALVSDSHLLLQYLNACLREQYTLVKCASPDALCDRSDLAQCQLVITDLSTNERQGFKMGLSMQAGGCLEDVPVLMLSQAIHWQLGKDSQFQPDQVLPMPVTPTALRQAVSTLIASGRVRELPWVQRRGA
ncbi:MAG: hypothetical protein RhofKO_29060 [Rhodothermales bacterium]